ncbi:MAG: small multi-drug export protein [Candidatus Cloacimonadota bacterium]|nr:small multi-drug export protein [Candidatus Cloacimonadota bacterium]
MVRVKVVAFILLLILLMSSLLFAENSDENGKQARFSKFFRDKNFSDEAIVVALATLPIFELRGSIPWAIHHYKMPWLKAYILSVIGNFLPIPFIFFILKFGLDFFSRIPLFARFFAWIFKRTRKKGELIKKYEALGLIMFVMIPLPITGGWTGSVAAYLFEVKFFPAMLCILIGICFAGVIVTILSLSGIWGALIALAALISLLVVWGINLIQEKKSNMLKSTGE